MDKEYLDSERNPLKEGFYIDTNIKELNILYVSYKPDWEEKHYFSGWAGESVPGSLTGRGFFISDECSKRLKRVDNPRKFLVNLNNTRNWLREKLEEIVQKKREEFEAMNTIPS